MATPVGALSMDGSLTLDTRLGPTHIGDGNLTIPLHEDSARQLTPGPIGPALARLLREAADTLDPDRPHLFSLERDQDVTGVSGTGRVADGVAWPDGTVTIRWRGTRPSTVNWSTLDDAQAVHGHGGATRIEWAGAAPGTTEDDQ